MSTDLFVLAKKKNRKIKMRRNASKKKSKNDKKGMQA